MTLFAISHWSAMLEINSSVSQTMVRFCAGDLSAEHLANLCAQPLDPLLATASRHAPTPCVPRKGMSGK